MIVNAHDLIVQIRMGSHLFGTSTPQSDLDLKAVYLPSARDILLQKVSPLLSGSRVKPHGEKNTAEDTDDEAYSLQRYLQLLAEGQTVALDMFFAPDWALTRPPSPVWKELKSLKPHILSKRATAFVRYCRQQANKYGIKGSRVAAVRKTVSLLQDAESRYGSTTRLGELSSELEAFAAGQDFAAIIDIPQLNNEPIRALEVCGKKAAFSMSLRNTLTIFQHMVNEYGQRALAAERNDGVDWKALSHAVRVGREAIELFSTGHITFPRPEAAHLLAIKRGEVPYMQVASEIEDLLEQTEKAATRSTMPDAPEMTIIDDFIENVYRRRVLENVPNE